VKVLVFGATGMVGQGVVRECLLADDVESVVAVGRTGAGIDDPKFTDVVRADLFDLGDLAALSDVDACFFCLGTPSAGMQEADYTRITHDLTMSVADALAAASPRATFVYVSGAGADSTERGRIMWARVRGRTENALLASPLNAFVLRPAFIQPRHGAQSKVALYRNLYRVVSVLYPALRLVAGRYMTTTEVVGRAMLALARGADPGTRILDSRDMNALA
jgi:uncharacterized protein YbjT (DUF2867 family)